MTPITDFDKYINTTIKNKSFETRRKQAYTIYLFYTFIFYSECNIYDLSETDIYNLVYFLAGQDDKISNATLITKRNVNSVASHLSTIRIYLFSLNIENIYLGSPSSKKSIKKITRFIKQELDGSIRYGQAANEVVSPEKFQKLVSITTQHNDLTIQIIIRMLYEYGFRLGEILGITLEDLSNIRTGPDTTEYFITLRDRPSDKSYQHSTRTLSVTGKDITNHSNYSEIPVPISETLYIALKNYIEWSANKRDYDYCYADNLTKKYDHNYYIFISKRGHSLSDQMLNERLRTYFDKASINTDSKSSRKNLSGKLRRSYIIRRITELKQKGLSDEKIKKTLAFELRYTDTYYLDVFFINVNK